MLIFFWCRDEYHRNLFLRPAKEGLEGVHRDGLVEIIKGVYGFKESPRKWYLSLCKILAECGWQQIRSAQGVFVARDSDVVVSGQLVIHVDNGTWSGHGNIFEAAVKRVCDRLDIGKEEVDDFVFLSTFCCFFANFLFEIICTATHFPPPKSLIIRY